MTGTRHDSRASSLADEVSSSSADGKLEPEGRTYDIVPALRTYRT